jgi:hypothetical protein
MNYKPLAISGCGFIPGREKHHKKSEILDAFLGALKIIPGLWTKVLRKRLVSYVF